MMKKIFASLIILILILFNVSPVFAADPPTPAPAPATAPTPAPVATPAVTTPKPATALKFLLNVPIGELKDFTIDSEAGNNGSDILGRYIQAWYGFLLGTIGIMATVMIMWGGFKYLTSRGDKGVIDTAKAQIISAITGVALAFGTYSILMLINPQLLTITTPNLPGLQGGDNVELTAVQAGVGSQEISTNSTVNGGLADTNFNADFKGTLSSIQQVVTTAGGIMPSVTPRGGVRIGDDGLHGVNRAADYPRNNPEFNAYMNQLISNGKPTGYGWNGPAYYVTFPDGSTGRVINEATCWHIDNGQRGEVFNGTTF